MLYCSWYMARDVCNSYFSFWAIFCLITHLTAKKIKISKKWKEHSEISPLYTNVLKIMIICYTVPEIWCMTDVIVIFHFGLFFALNPPPHPHSPPPPYSQKIKISIKWEKLLERSLFYTCVPKIMIRWCTVPEIWCATDGWTDGWKKWHIEVGAPPKKSWWLKKYTRTLKTSTHTPDKQKQDMEPWNIILSQRNGSPLTHKLIISQMDKRLAITVQSLVLAFIRT